MRLWPLPLSLLAIAFLLAPATSVPMKAPSLPLHQHQFAVLDPLKPAEGAVGCPVVDWHNSTAGRVYSPGYPNNYPNNANCTYTITGPPGMQITMVFYVFQVEMCCDSLAIYEGSSELQDLALIDTIKGNLSASYEYRTNASNSMTLVFTSDPNINFAGFYAIFSASNAPRQDPNAVICPDPVNTEPFGVVASPDWPQQYPNNAECTYMVGNGTAGTKLQLEIESFDTEGCCDILYVYDGPDNNSNLLIQLSGPVQAGSTYTSSGPYVYMRFFSDPNKQYPGFSISYKIVDVNSSDTEGPHVIVTDQLRGKASSPHLR